MFNRPQLNKKVVPALTICLMLSWQTLVSDKFSLPAKQVAAGVGIASLILLMGLVTVSTGIGLYQLSRDESGDLENQLQPRGLRN